MGGFEINGVNGSTPLFGTNGTTKADKAGKTFDFGFNTNPNMEIGDSYGNKGVDNTLEVLMALATKEQKINPETEKTIEALYAYSDETQDLADEFINDGISFDHKDLDIADFMFKYMSNPV